MKGPSSHPNTHFPPLGLPEGVPGTNLLYRLCRRALRVFLPAFWKVRVFDRRLEPVRGSAVYISNHQSFLDPMLMSFALRRSMNYMARDTLFRLSPFRWLITSLGAFPVKRGTGDLGAIKEAMRRLKHGGQVVIFAEGTRTRNGKIGPFLPGVAVLSQRSADWTVPVVIDGAFEAWPRGRTLPRPGFITVRYGEPIPRERAAGMTPQQFVDSVRRTIIDLQTDVRRRTGRPALNY